MTGEVIALTGVEVFAHHGVFEAERSIGQRFLIDVELSIDLAEAADNDDLASTVDYGALAVAIQDRVSGERWNLIERVAQRVADLVLEDVRVASVTVTVHKPGAPIAVTFGDVAITLTRSRR